MSLIRQIWLLLLGSLVLAAAGSVGVVVTSARDTLQTQLRIKNNDNAQSLALALSQQKGDPELMELVLSAQFDTGFYQRIRLDRADGKPGFVRQAESREARPSSAPAWFVRLLPIQSAPGVAQVSDGWRALGTLSVVSQTAFAHDELWSGSLHSAAALLVVGVVAALIARLVVQRIRRPLDQTVEQASSLVNGIFVTVKESRVPELRDLTRAMNGMVARLKQMFAAQAEQVETLRREAHSDALTGLANRTHFMGQLGAQLAREDSAGESGLLLLRVLDLATINRGLGHATTDRMIEAVAQVLASYTARVDGCHAGRLNGSDFALCLPVSGLAFETAEAIAQALKATLPAFGPGIGIAIGAIEVQGVTDLGRVMSGADLALARAESQGAFTVERDYLPRPRPEEMRETAPAMGEAAWRESIKEALVRGRVKLAGFPMLDAKSQLLHLECPLRLQLAASGEHETAARWLPLALRGRLTAEVDERAVELALAAIAEDGQPRCVNLSQASLTDVAFGARLRALLRESPAEANRLWLDVPESAAAEQFPQVQELARQLRPLGARIGLEHAGERLGRIDRLFEGGIDYVKLAGSTVRGVAGDEARAAYVKGVSSMLHGLSIAVYAEGVADGADAALLWSLGIDGMTGPWASDLRRDLVS